MFDKYVKEETNSCMQTPPNSHLLCKGIYIAAIG